MKVKAGVLSNKINRQRGASFGMMGWCAFFLHE
jgi:hypothetical protein